MPYVMHRCNSNIHSFPYTCSLKNGENTTTIQTPLLYSRRQWAYAGTVDSNEVFGRCDQSHETKMKKTRLDYGAPHWSGPPVAVLWTQSLVWGLLCIDTLSKLEVPFQLLSASQVCGGSLDGFRILIVPGGWAAHKVRALGETGRLKIAGFIDEGGSYIGFCGGAGLALSHPPALYLTPIRRMPVYERLPSASGQIYVSGTLSHPAWQNIPARIPVSVWWPSQFQMDPTSPPGSRRPAKPTAWLHTKHPARAFRLRT